MIRSPHRMLERLEAPGTTEQHAVRRSIASSRRLESALATVRQRGEMNLASSVVPLVSVSSYSALVPRRGAVPVLPVDVRLTTRQVRHVPQLAKPRRFPVASIDLSRADVGLPYGIPRHVNAATLKALAGGRRFDNLLRKTSAGWELVSDDTVIDLSHNSAEFKLGRLTIFS